MRCQSLTTDLHRSNSIAWRWVTLTMRESSVSYGNPGQEYNSQFLHLMIAHSIASILSDSRKFL